MNEKTNLSTEEKIMNAARKVFQQKGYSATRTRDIADEAGINLALLNYYFRSKEKLFELIMRESLIQFLSGIIDVTNDEKTTFEEKIAMVTERYLDMFKGQPNLPVFVIGELRSMPVELSKILPIKQTMESSVLRRQFDEKVASGEITNPDPINCLLNLLGFIVMPFFARPVLTSAGVLNENTFDQLMEKRKALIPMWIESIIKI